ncbi:MAG: NUDIX domain-containing protein [Sphingobium sp.]
MSNTPMEIRPAATLIVARQVEGDAPQFLMAQRATTMQFAAGAMVFPGGAVDEQDRVHAHSLGIAGEADDIAARIAAIRETIEECGLAVGLQDEVVSPRDLREMRSAIQSGGSFLDSARTAGVTFNPEKMVAFARWCPPTGRERRRFDTRFYVTVLEGDGEGLVPDGTETIALGWYSAQEMLDRADAGLAKIIFPTRRNLERLAQFDALAPLMDHARSHQVSMITPWIEERDGVDHLCIPEGLGYPVTSEPVSAARRG